MLVLTFLLLTQAPLADCAWDEHIRLPDVRVGTYILAPGSTCDEGNHSFAEIHYVLEGASSYRLGSDAFEADKGTAILVPEGVAHRLENPGELPLKVLVYRWAPGGDESALHAASTMTDPVTVPDVPSARQVRPRRYEPGTSRGEHLWVRQDDVDWTTNFTYDEELWKVYRYKPLIREPLAEWAGVSRDDVRMGLQELEPGAAYPGHHHPSPEIYVVLSGEARWHLGEEPFTVTSGDAIFTPPNTRHRIENVGAERLQWLYLWWAPGGDSAVLE